MIYEAFQKRGSGHSGGVFLWWVGNGYLLFSGFYSALVAASRFGFSLLSFFGFFCRLPTIFYSILADLPILFCCVPFFGTNASNVCLASYGLDPKLGVSEFSFISLVCDPLDLINHSSAVVTCIVT